MKGCKKWAHGMVAGRLVGVIAARASHGRKSRSDDDDDENDDAKNFLRRRQKPEEQLSLGRERISLSWGPKTQVLEVIITIIYFRLISNYMDKFLY